MLTVKVHSEPQQPTICGRNLSWESDMTWQMKATTLSKALSVVTGSIILWGVGGLPAAAQDPDRPMVIARDMDLNSLDPARALGLARRRHAWIRLH